MMKPLEVSNGAKWQKFGISMLTQPCFPWAIDITAKNLCLNYCVAPPPSAAGGFDRYDKPVQLISTTVSCKQISPISSQR